MSIAVKLKLPQEITNGCLLNNTHPSVEMLYLLKRSYNSNEFDCHMYIFCLMELKGSKKHFKHPFCTLAQC